MTSERPDTAEFSRPIDLARLGDAEAVHEIEATAPERAALADRFSLVALRSLRATLKVRRIRGGAAIQLSGHLAADVTQACVVTLDPVDGHVEEDFTIIYAAETWVEDSTVGSDMDTDWPEPMPEGLLDIGEAVAQQLSLALDPYPRAPGVKLEQERPGDDGGTESPFARLAELRRRPRSSG